MITRAAGAVIAAAAMMLVTIVAAWVAWRRSPEPFDVFDDEEPRPPRKISELQAIDVAGLTDDDAFVVTEAAPQRRSIALGELRREIGGVDPEGGAGK